MGQSLFNNCLGKKFWGYTLIVESGRSSYIIGHFYIGKTIQKGLFVPNF